MQAHFSPEKIKYVHPDALKPNPRNRNKHPQNQIDRLVQLIESHGFRTPIIVSSRSGLVVSGHGRLLAAKQMRLTEVPVVFQDFESEEQEWAFGVSDNAIASWADLDLSGINMDLPDFGPDFNIDLLGINGFSLDPKEVKNSGTELDLKDFDNFQHECPKCGFEWNDDGST